jgi:hypothetical protein
MWPLTAKYTVTQSDWMLSSPEKKKISILDLTSVVAPAHPVSLIVKHIWLGVKIQVCGNFQEVLLAMKILKGHLFM